MCIHMHAYTYVCAHVHAHVRHSSQNSRKKMRTGLTMKVSHVGEWHSQISVVKVSLMGEWQSKISVETQRTLER